MKNSPTRYGFVTKLFHWTIFLIFLNQFIVAVAMINTPQGQTTAGFTTGDALQLAQIHRASSFWWRSSATSGARPRHSPTGRQT